MHSREKEEEADHSVVWSDLIIIPHKCVARFSPLPLTPNNSMIDLTFSAL